MFMETNTEQISAKITVFVAYFKETLLKYVTKCLLVLWFNIPVNNLSVMMGWSNHFIGIDKHM